MTSGQVASIVLQAARGRLLVDRRGDAVRGEDDGRALGHLVGLLDEDRAASLEGRHDVLVVDDLLADVDRGAVQVERLLHRDHRAVDARRSSRAGRPAGAPRSSGPARRLRPRSDRSRLHPSIVGAAARSPCRSRPRAEQPLPVRTVARHDRRVGLPARPGLGRGPGRPAHPTPRRRHLLPDPARPGRRRLDHRHLPDPGARRGRPAPGRRRPRRRPGQAGLLPRPRLALAGRALEIRPVGLGQLLARLEQLRATARRRGPVRRRPQAGAAVPAPHRRPDLRPRARPPSATSSRTPGGAGPASSSRVENVAVQGAYAVPEVIDALRRLDRDPEVDVIVITRGGGSVEDLLPFSEENLVRAVAACFTPGRQRHRARAGHPAARPRRRRPGLDADRRRAARRPRRRARSSTGIAIGREPGTRGRRGPARARAARPRRPRAPGRCCADPDVLDSRAAARPRGAPRGGARTRAVATVSTGPPTSSATCAPSVLALSPAATLERGYAIVQRTDGEVVRDPDEVAAGRALRVRVAAGDVRPRGTVTVRRAP